MNFPTNRKTPMVVACELCSLVDSWVGLRRNHWRPNPALRRARQNNPNRQLSGRHCPGGPDPDLHAHADAGSRRDADAPFRSRRRYAVDERPNWWQEGETKHYRGTFPMVGNSNPGFWDVHYGGSLNTTLMPSSPRFNQLVEYNPVMPSEIIGDLASTWEVSDDGTEFVFHLKDATWSDGNAGDLLRTWSSAWTASPCREPSERAPVSFARFMSIKPPR